MILNGYIDGSAVIKKSLDFEYIVDETIAYNMLLIQCYWLFNCIDLNLEI